MQFVIIVLVAALCAVSCLPFDVQRAEVNMVDLHNIEMRVDNSDLRSDVDNSGTNRLRTKRSDEDCEKLELCRLHARSRHNFFAAYELYFVNRENARLWDHRSRSIQECNHRYSCYRK